MTSSINTEIDWDGFMKSGMDETGCKGGCFECSSWGVVGDEGATMSLDTASCTVPLPGCAEDHEVF